MFFYEILFMEFSFLFLISASDDLFCYYFFYFYVFSVFLTAFVTPKEPYRPLCTLWWLLLWNYSSFLGKIWSIWICNPLVESYLFLYLILGMLKFSFFSSILEIIFDWSLLIELLDSLFFLSVELFFIYFFLLTLKRYNNIGICLKYFFLNVSYCYNLLLTVFVSFLILA